MFICLPPRRRGATGLILALLIIASVAVQGAEAQSTQNWPTYHHDFARSGLDASQSSTSSVTPDWSLSNLDGPVYAEPLMVGTMVLLATEGDTVYGVDAGSGNLIWSTNLGDPALASELPCGNIDPVGITGTPVVDTDTGTIYVAALIRNPFRHILAALSMSDGSIRWNLPIDPPGADPTAQNQRGALALADGRVYVPFGGRAGDCGNYHGLVVSANKDGSGGLITYQVPTDRMAGIWAPGGISVDSASNLYVATGNSESTTQFDYGNAVIKFTPTLDVVSYFAPTNWAELNAQDGDLGSMPPTLLSDGLIFQIGKEGVGYLLRTANLGGVGDAPFSMAVCDPIITRGAYGAAAYAPPYVYAPCSEGLVALQIDPSGPRFSVAWRGPQFVPGPPIISGGLLWTIDRGNAMLHAFDPSTGQDVFDATVDVPQNHFPSLASANGRLVLGVDGGAVTFLLSSGSPLPTIRSAAAPTRCPDVRLSRSRPATPRAQLGRAGRAGPPLTHSPGTRLPVPVWPRCIVSSR